MTGLRRGPHVTRYYMYRRLATVAAGLPSRAGTVLSISSSGRLVARLGLGTADVTRADYPEVDILHLPFPDASFDFVVADQVLEHVAGDPQHAVDECRRVLRDGGIAVQTSCLINPIHACPGDYWRFTPSGLVLLHRGWSQVIESGGWGNRKVWSLEAAGLRYEGVPHASWHPLHRIAMANDPDWPIVTWIVARR
jgi:SAM-dependent methyltransferase